MGFLAALLLLQMAARRNGISVAGLEDQADDALRKLGRIVGDKLKRGAKLHCVPPHSVRYDDVTSQIGLTIGARWGKGAVEIERLLDSLGGKLDIAPTAIRDDLVEAWRSDRRRTPNVEPLREDVEDMEPLTPLGGAPDSSSIPVDTYMRKATPGGAGACREGVPDAPDEGPTGEIGRIRPLRKAKEGGDGTPASSAPASAARRVAVPREPQRSSDSSKDPEAVVQSREVIERLAAEPRWERIRQACESGADTQKQIARHCNITPRTLRRWMKDFKELLTI